MTQENEELIGYTIRMTKLEHQIITTAAKADKRSVNSFLILAGLDKAEELGLVDKLKREE